MRYYLFVPRSLKPGEHYPLLLWLHWGDETKIFNEGQLSSVIDDPHHIEKYHFFVLAIPNSLDDPGWQRGVGGTNFTDADSTQALDILQKVMCQYPVDQDRVSLTGICRGSRRCLEMAMRYPKLFSAITTLAYLGGDESHLASLARIPIWVFHSSDDPHVSSDRSRELAAALKREGGIVDLTIVPLDQIDCWTAAFKKYYVTAWMLAQRRGAASYWRCRAVLITLTTRGDGGISCRSPLHF